MSIDLVAVQDGDEATRLALYGLLARYRGATLRDTGRPAGLICGGVALGPGAAAGATPESGAAPELNGLAPVRLHDDRPRVRHGGQLLPPVRR